MSNGFYHKNVYYLSMKVPAKNIESSRQSLKYCYGPLHIYKKFDGGWLFIFGGYHILTASVLL